MLDPEKGKLRRISSLDSVHYSIEQRHKHSPGGGHVGVLETRPVGVALFGHYRDRVGRKKALAASSILLVIPTTLIGVLPTYGQVGLLEPILVIVMRLAALHWSQAT